MESVVVVFGTVFGEAGGVEASGDVEDHGGGSGEL